MESSQNSTLPPEASSAAARADALALALQDAQTVMCTLMDLCDAAEEVLPNSTDDDMVRAILKGQRALLGEACAATHQALQRREVAHVDRKRRSETASA